MSEQDLSVAAALGRIPSGVFVLSARRGAEATGMLASWVQQCAFDPPHVSVVILRERYINAWLAPGEAFVLNVVSEADKTLVAHFGRGFARGEPAFQGLDVHQSGSEQPILARALAHLECAVVERVASGDHDLIVARVTAGAMHGEGQPMIHVRKNGFKY